MPDKYSASEVQQVIGEAAKTQTAVQDHYTEDEVIVAGREVGLSADSVKHEMAALEEKKVRSAARRALVKKAGWWTLVGLAALLIVAQITLAIGGGIARGGLREHFEQVAARRAQVQRVWLRKQETELLWKEQAPSSEKQAELAGAINRVSIEARRYDVAVREYNDLAASWWGREVLKTTSWPSRLPYSSEVTTW